MPTRYRVATSLMDDSPEWALVIPDDPGGFVLAPSDTLTEEYAARVRELHADGKVAFSEASIVKALVSLSGYTSIGKAVEVDAPLSEVVPMVEEILSVEQFERSPRGREQQLIRAAYHESVVSAPLVEVEETEDGVVPVPEEETRALLEAAGVLERFRKPGMGYPVPEDWRERFQALGAGEPEEPESAVEPEPEEPEPGPEQSEEEQP